MFFTRDHREAQKFIRQQQIWFSLLYFWGHFLGNPCLNATISRLDMTLPWKDDFTFKNGITRHLYNLSLLSFLRLYFGCPNYDEPKIGRALPQSTWNTSWHYFQQSTWNTSWHYFQHLLLLIICAKNSKKQLIMITFPMLLNFYLVSYGECLP